MKEYGKRKRPKNHRAKSQTYSLVLFWGRYHRFNVARKRANLVKDYKLIETVDKADCIDPQKKLALHYLVKTRLTSKSKWNSAVIFILSFVALLIGIVMDIFGI